MEKERRTAFERLKQGDIHPLLAMDLSVMGDFARVDASAPFYAGLLVEASGDRARAARLYEAALGSPVQKVTSEAARKLAPFLAETNDTEQAARVLAFVTKTKPRNRTGEHAVLKNAALYALGRTGDIVPHAAAEDAPPLSDAVSEKAAETFDAWNKAFLLTASAARQTSGQPTDGVSNGASAADGAAENELRAFLCDYPVDDAYRWLFAELSGMEGYALPAPLKAAAQGRIAASEQDYGEALLHFDTVRDREPSLLFRHTELLSDLGRSYMASARDAGFDLFTAWESAIRTGKNSPLARGASRAGDNAELSAAEQDKLRYTLLFYAGRIRRQQRTYGESAELFTRALALAPDNTQKDACVWYILHMALTEDPDSVPALIDKYARVWHRDGDFADILDRLSVHLVAQKKWGVMADVFSSIRNGTDGAIIARYAYLVGRAVFLGYLPERNLAAGDFFTAAYEKGDASFYYRALAASYLGKTVVPLNGRQGNGREAFPHADELEFYVQFFEFGADDYAMGYVRENARRYTARELRTLAKSFAASERYLESIQIAGMYMYRDTYVMEKDDLELLYPQYFTELVEKNARDNGLHPSLYFGLIRTESAFSPGIASHAGAIGLAQIMPATGREIAATIKRRGGPDYAASGSIDLTNPDINALFGAVFLKDLTNSLGSPMLALLAYNGGPARVRRLRRAAPNLPEDLFLETITIAETRNYGKRVAAAAAAYGYLYYDMSMHEVVNGIFK